MDNKNHWINSLLLTMLHKIPQFHWKEGQHQDNLQEIIRKDYRCLRNFIRKSLLSIIYIAFLSILSAALLKDALAKDTGDDSPGMELENLLEGFEEESAQITKPHTPTMGKSFWDMSGSLTLGSSYNYSHNPPLSGQTDYRGLSRLRVKFLAGLKLTLPYQWKFNITGDGFYDLAYHIKGRDQFKRELLDQQERELELGEAYLQGTLLSNLDLKVGRQIVVWGKSDNIRITDVLNPLDNREPGMVDIEDLRLPVTMMRFDYYFGNWDLSTILILEKRFDKNPAFGSDFNPFLSPLPEEKIPGGIEYAFAMSGIFSGWDIAFYAARIFDDEPHFEQNVNMLELRHSHLSMGGFSANLSHGDFLLKTEVAGFYGLEFRNLPREKKSRYDVLLGLEYQGFANQALSFEISNRHIADFKAELNSAPDSAEENELQAAIRYSGDFNHDRFHVLLLASAFGTKLDGGSFQRFSVEYDLYDAFSVSGGAINYDSGDLDFFKTIGNNDRIFLNFKYSFSS